MDFFNENSPRTNRAMKYAALVVLALLAVVIIYLDFAKWPGSFGTPL